MKVSNKDSKAHGLLTLGCILTFIGPISLIFFATGRSPLVVILITIITIFGIALILYSWRKLQLKFSELIEIIFYHGVS